MQYLKAEHYFRSLELVAQVATELGIDNAGFDVAVVQERCYLLECNVFFGLDGINK